jgi:hypothetical protein
LERPANRPARGINVERKPSIDFDLLRALALGLLLNSISVRDHLAPPGFFDRLQPVHVISAVLFATLALRAIATPFRAGRSSLAQLERWQTSSLPMNAVWGWIIFVMFPVLFQFVEISRTSTVRPRSADHGRDD